MIISTQKPTSSFFRFPKVSDIGAFALVSLLFIALINGLESVQWLSAQQAQTFELGAIAGTMTRLIGVPLLHKSGWRGLVVFLILSLALQWVALPVSGA